MENKDLLKLESALLSRVVDEHNTRDAILSILKADDFLDKNHQAIMRAVVSLSNDSLPVDSITVNNWLTKKEPREDVSWAYIVGTLELASFSELPVHHAKIIKENAFKRSVTNDLQTCLTNISKNRKDVLESLETLLSRIDNGVTDVQSKSFKSFAEIKEKTKQEVASGDSAGIVLTGLQDLDEKTNGFKQGNLVVIAARPAMGKSALMSTIARSMASTGLSIYVFSLEMEDSEIVDRMISSDVGIDNGKIIGRQLDDYEQQMFLDKVDEVEDIPLYVYDKGGLTLRKLKAELKKAHKTTGLGAVFVDYLQLMSNSGDGNRENEISEISRTLKALAKEYKVPIITLSQLNRQVENREFKIPFLSDLRESGAIEQDADMVILLWRPSYYGYKSLPFDPVTKEDINTIVEDHDAYAIVAKNRKGSTGASRLTFQGRFARFTS